jgi:hypothetical protein
MTYYLIGLTGAFLATVSGTYFLTTWLEYRARRALVLRRLRTL